MQYSTLHYSQPSLNQYHYNSSTDSVKNIHQQGCHNNQSLSYQTQDCSSLLNALSFRQSTVAYADRLIMNTNNVENPQNQMILNGSMTSSISCILHQNINEKRDLVVNWIALIHTKYWFEQQTFHLAVSIIDRYLLRNPDPNIDFELLAVTAFWVAAKIQERKIKELKVWMKLGRGFLKNEIIEMQQVILQALEYQIIVSTSQMIIWQLIQNCTNLQNKSIHLSLYILELSLLNSSFNKYQPGIIAISSIYLCSKIHGIQQTDTNIHNLFLNHWDQIRKCSRKLCKTLQKAQGDLKSPIVRKFGSKKYSQVAFSKFGKKSDSTINFHSQSSINFR